MTSRPSQGSTWGGSAMTTHLPLVMLALTTCSWLCLPHFSTLSHRFPLFCWFVFCGNDSCLHQPPLMVTTWRFSVSVISFTCISWYPAIIAFPFPICLFYLYQLGLINFYIIQWGGLGFTWMLHLFVIWPGGGLSPCPFDLFPSFVEHLLTFWQKRFPDSSCISPAPALETAVLPRSLVSLSWGRYLGTSVCTVEVLLATEILLFLILSIEKARMYMYTPIHTHYTYICTHTHYI